MSPFPVQITVQEDNGTKKRERNMEKKIEVEIKIKIGCKSTLDAGRTQTEYNHYPHPSATVGGEW